MAEIEELKRQLAMACRMLFFAEVNAADILTADLDGKRIAGKWNLPSKLPMHTRTYRVRKDVQCVAHLHNRMVVVLSMAEKPLIPASNTGAFFGPGPTQVYPDPALIHTDEQGDEVARTLGTNNAVMLPKPDWPVCWRGSEIVSFGNRLVISQTVRCRRVYNQRGKAYCNGVYFVI